MKIVLHQNGFQHNGNHYVPCMAQFRVLNTHPQCLRLCNGLTGSSPNPTTPSYRELRHTLKHVTSLGCRRLKEEHHKIRRKKQRAVIPNPVQDARFNNLDHWPNHGLQVPILPNRFLNYQMFKMQFGSLFCS
jgi:hypothetical protein